MATTTARAPIAHYDDLTVRELLPLLELLTDDELEAVAGHERTTKRRVSVLRRIQKLQTGENTEAPWDIEPHWAVVGDPLDEAPVWNSPPPPPPPPPAPPPPQPPEPPTMAARPPVATPTTPPSPAVMTRVWAPPSEPPPPASATEPRRSRGPQVLAVVIVMVAIAAMAALAVVAGESTSSSPASSSRLTSGSPPTTGATATRQAPVPATTPPTGPGTLAAWSARNRADLVALQSTFYEISRTGTSGDMPGMGRACQKMQAAVATVRGDLPVPDPVVNDHMATGLDLYSQSAQLCEHGVRTRNADELLQARDRMMQATAQLQDALAAGGGAGVGTS